ncbi:hypothetical protein [Kitasatospora paranensis]|uniref:hypothetical protein n=1 Tax=Kitasatospora paranensis TaxID=258053 RepID=UPI0031E8FDA7
MMIQVTGLTKVYRRGRPPALLDLSFDARPGTVTVLLGEGARARAPRCASWWSWTAGGAPPCSTAGRTGACVTRSARSG